MYYNRRTIVTFHEDPNLGDAEFTFVDESPRTIYVRNNSLNNLCHAMNFYILYNQHFEVKGSFTGQPKPDEKCVVNSTNPCVATCAGEKFDISKVFQYP